MIILILGKTGVGKTSLGVAMAIKEMDKGQEALEVARDKLSSFSGYSKVKLPSDHLVYTDIYINGTEVNNKPNIAHFSNGFRFGLPNSDFETDYFPYGSTIVYDEARKYWPARKSMLDFKSGGTHEKVLEAFELSRQGGLTIILITQLIRHLDLNIRSLAHKVIEPYEITQEVVGKKLKHTITKWKYKEFAGVEEYERYYSGDKTIKVLDEEFVFDGDIFEFYDSEYFIFKYLYGLKKYSSNKLTPCDGSKRSVEKLVELYGDMRIKEKTKRKMNDAVRKSGRAITNYL